MNPLFRLFAWVESFTFPKFCPDCGAALERVTEDGVGRFVDEVWTVLQCPHYAAFSNWTGRHYSHVIHWETRPRPFDPRTGKPRGVA